MTSTNGTTRPAAGESLAIAHRGSLRIVVVGTGCVGLVTAACLASHGHRVVAIDADHDKVARLSEGDVALHEAGLAGLVRDQLAAGRLCFSSEPDRAVGAADLVFVAVGTPANSDGSTDMGAIDRAVVAIAANVRAPAVVVLKSTVPVGTARRVQALLNDSCPNGETAATVLSNPEFLREGSAVADFLRPERLVIGDDTQGGRACEVLLDAYSALIESGVPLVVMDTRSAELSKLAANAMLAVRVSFINEIAAISSATGADIEKVCEGIGSDRRIGRDFLRPGLGYGGSCFPKDVAALRETARRHNLRTDVLLATQRVNDRQRCWALQAIQRDGGSRAGLRELRVAVWGLAFKPGTDDVRCAPSLALVDSLLRAGVHLRLYDPLAMGNARRALTPHRRIAWADSAVAALEGADALVLVTEWPEFIAFDPATMAARSRPRTVYDGRNALDTERWLAANVRVRQVGRSIGWPTAHPHPWVDPFPVGAASTSSTRATATVPE